MRRMTKALAVVVSSLGFVPLALAQSEPTWILLNPASDQTPGLVNPAPDLPPGTPAPRTDFGAVYDALNQRMMIFGGRQRFGYLNDMWVLSDAVGLAGTSQWTNIGTPFLPGLPTPRAYHSTVYDPATNALITFAGLDPSFNPLNDVWAAANANGLGGALSWRQLSPLGTSPDARAASAATYDPLADGMTIFGGNGSMAYGDAWVLTNANGIGGTPSWSMLHPATGPSPRYSHSSVYDQLNDRLIVFGGSPPGGVTLLNEAWVLTNANGLSGTPGWTLLNPLPDPTWGSPSARASHTAVYDPGTNRMTIFGGNTLTPSMQCCWLYDVWVLTNANGLGGTPAWMALIPPTIVGGGYAPPGTPGTRTDHGAVYDKASNRMTIFGGRGNGCLPLLYAQQGFDWCNDVWVLTNANGLSEIPVLIAIKPPAAAPVPINLKANGVIPVAILSTGSFDATQVNPATVSLSGAEVKLKGKTNQYSCSNQDVNGDGIADLVCQVIADELNLKPGASVAVLTGATNSGQAIRGSEGIVIVPQ